MGEHRVRGELREFRGPEADSEDSLLAKDWEIVRLIIMGRYYLNGYSRDPVGVDILEALACAETLRCLQGSNQNAIRAKKVRDGCSLCEEFRIGEDVEVAVGLGVGLENGAH